MARNMTFAIVAIRSPFFTSAGSMGRICLVSRKSTTSLPVGTEEEPDSWAFSLAGSLMGSEPLGLAVVLVCSVEGAMPLILLLRATWSGSSDVNFLGKARERRSAHTALVP